MSLKRLSARSDNSAPSTDRELRRLVTLPGFALLEDGSTFSITLVDLSYDGCKIDSPIALLPGVELKLSVLGLGALDAQVRWSSGKKVGLTFGVNTQTAAPETPRKHCRQSLNAEVLLRGPSRPNYRTRVFDLSPTGCKIDFVERPKIGDKLWIKLEGLDALEGDVRWLDDFIGGVQFRREIHPAVFELHLARLKATENEQ